MHPSDGLAGEATGNDYISIAGFGRDGSIPGVSVLHAGLSGLVEWAGDAEPLLRLRVLAAGQEVPLGEAQWRRLDRWIPTFTVQAGDVAIAGTICAPTGYPSARGFFIRVDVEHSGRAAVPVEVRLDLCWATSRLWIASGRPLPGQNQLSEAGPGLLLLETDDGRGPALAVGAAGNASVAGLETGVVQSGAPQRATLVQGATVVPKRKASFTFLVGAGRERDGAVAAAEAMNRRGPDDLMRQTRLDLAHTLRAAQDHRWSDMLNRNLLFARYFAAGRAIDDDQLWLVRSRSTQCPAPALFNEREALLWTLPALVAADPGIAREALLRSLDVYSERSGERLRYVGGGAFDSGFVLEQFLLYAWAIDFYVTTTQDSSILDEAVVQQVVLENDAALYMRLHPEHLLCSTELLPSGDMADFAYTTMGNALVRFFAQALPRLWPKLNGAGEEPPPRFEGTGDEVAAAVWQHITADVRGEQIFACAADLEGQVAVYDDPAMSLGLLPFFGFCDPDDPTWLATMEFLRSAEYPLHAAGQVPGVAHRRNPGQPALAGLVADLLGPASGDALDRLLRLHLPGGFAAATWDPETGEGREPHHAALAGFLAWVLVRVAEPRQPPRGRRNRR